TGTATEAGGYANATVGSNATGNVLTNDTDVDTVANGETKTVTGVVAGTAGSAAGSVGTSVTGNYGSITIGSNGTFTYVVNESNATVQALRLTSQTITDVFTYTVTDAGGLTATNQVTVTIQGANDAPVSFDDTTTAAEAGGLSNGTAGTSPTGNVLTNDTDVDTTANGETKTVTGVAAGSQVSATGSVGVGVTGTYGSISIDANGAYTYTVDNSNTAVQALRISGQTLSEVFTYTMADTAGLTSTSKITVTITGANDTPVAVNDSNTAVEAGGVANGTAGTNPTGNVLTNDTDVDTVANGETKTVTGVAAGSVSSPAGSVGVSVTGTYGSINIGSTGAYIYTVDNSNTAVQALRLTSQTLSETFTYTMADAGGLT
ncbi:MAG: VCBS domain-containing protein, partial [Pirellula sp.]